MSRAKVNRKRQIRESADDYIDNQTISLDDEQNEEEPEPSSMQNGVYVEFNEDEATELLFDFKEDTHIGVLGRFLVWGLVTDDLQYDAVQLDIDGEEYGITSMPDGMKADYIHNLFIEVVNDYLRDCQTRYDCWSGWEIFNYIKDGMTVVDGVFTTKIPQYDEWEEEIIQYELELQTGDEKFYVCDNNCLVLDINNEVIVLEDLNNYESYFGYVATDVLNGEEEIIYASDRMEEVLNDADIFGDDEV